AETADTMAQREFRLLLPGLCHTQVVESQVSRNVRLVVSCEKRLSLDDIPPLGKSLTPPFIVLGDGMKLWQVECDKADACVVASSFEQSHARWHLLIVPNNFPTLRQALVQSSRQCLCTDVQWRAISP